MNTIDNSKSIFRTDENTRVTMPPHLYSRIMNLAVQMPVTPGELGQAVKRLVAFCEDAHNRIKTLETTLESNNACGRGSCTAPGCSGEERQADVRSEGKSAKPGRKNGSASGET